MSVSVASVASVRSRAEIMRARRRRAGTARAQRVVVGAVVAVVAVVTLLLTAFGSGSTVAERSADVAAASRLLPVGPPQAEVIASAGSLRIQLPVPQERLTAIGYHGVGDGAVALAPVGSRGNRGLLSRLFHAVFGGGGSGPRWYQLPGGSGAPTGALDVGAPPGTMAYAPVDGAIVAVADEVVDGKRVASRIDVRPVSAPGVIVSIYHLEPSENVTVGAAVAAGATPIGRVVDLSGVESLVLSRFTQDAGNHVEIEVRPAPTTPVSS